MSILRKKLTLLSLLSGLYFFESNCFAQEQTLTVKDEIGFANLAIEDDIHEHFYILGDYRNLFSDRFIPSTLNNASKLPLCMFHNVPDFSLDLSPLPASFDEAIASIQLKAKHIMYILYQAQLGICPYFLHQVYYRAVITLQQSYFTFLEKDWRDGSPTLEQEAQKQSVLALGKIFHSDNSFEKTFFGEGICFRLLQDVFIGNSLFEGHAEEASQVEWKHFILNPEYFEKNALHAKYFMPPNSPKDIIETFSFCDIVLRSFLIPMTCGSMCQEDFEFLKNEIKKLYDLYYEFYLKCKDISFDLGVLETRDQGSLQRDFPFFNKFFFSQKTFLENMKGYKDVQQFLKQYPKVLEPVYVSTP
jgi:uncharacterized protein YqgQ